MPTRCSTQRSHKACRPAKLCRRRKIIGIYHLAWRHDARLHRRTGRHPSLHIARGIFAETNFPPDCPRVRMAHAA